VQLLQLLVSTDRLVPVTEALDEMGATYLQTDETSARDVTLLYVPVPRGGAEPVLERLYDAGLPEDAYALATDVDTATGADLGVSKLADEYVDGPKGEAGIDHTSLRERAEDLTPGRRTYVAFAALSAIVAVAGLLLDSAIVIVGAMVIAPFAGSSLSAAVGAVISDRDMVTDSVTSQVLGLVVAFVGAVAMSFVLQSTGFVPRSLSISQIEQLGSFLTPSLLAVAIAIAAGGAGALALATDLPVSIAGVAVAAAIVPAASTAGIGVVWGEPLVVAGGLVLLAMNIAFINVSAYLALIALGYRSSVIGSVREDLTLSVRTGAYALVLVFFLVTLAATSVATYQYLTFEQAANSEVQETLDDETFEALDLVSVSTSYSAGVIDTEAPSVTVTVARTSDLDYPLLATILRDRIEAATGRPVIVQIHFVDYSEAQATGMAASRDLTVPTAPLAVTATRRVPSIPAVA